MVMRMRQRNTGSGYLVSLGVDERLCGDQYAIHVQRYLRPPNEVIDVRDGNEIPPVGRKLVLEHCADLLGLVCLHLDDKGTVAEECLNASGWIRFEVEHKGKVVSTSLCIFEALDSNP